MQCWIEPRRQPDRSQSKTVNYDSSKFINHAIQGLFSVRPRRMFGQQMCERVGRYCASTGSFCGNTDDRRIVGTVNMANSIFTILTVTGIVVGAATVYVANKANAEQRQFRGYGVNSTGFSGYGVPRSIRYKRGYAILSPESPPVEDSDSGLHLTKIAAGGPKIIRVSTRMKQLAEERAVRRAELRGSEEVFDHALNLPDASEQRNEDVIYAND